MNEMTKSDYAQREYSPAVKALAGRGSRPNLETRTVIIQM
jgi:hypothetical protein